MKLNLLVTVFILNIIFITTRKPKGYLSIPNSDLSYKPCGLNKSHFMCNIQIGPMSHCSDFQLYTITPVIITRIMNGINGLRSREARLLGHQIPNMNLLYWDEDLAHMAKQYLYHCDTSNISDSTSYIGLPVKTVRQTYFYIKKTLNSPQWFQMPLHFWYKTSWVNKPTPLVPHAPFTPYTQIVWPTCEYVGCAGARVFKGTLFVCYFAPRAEETDLMQGVTRGAMCSACPNDRPTCSLKYGNLCGNDFAVIENRPKPYMVFGMLVIGVFGCQNVHFI